MAPTDQDYGSRDFSARDPEGNIWSFGTYRPESASWLAARASCCTGASTASRRS